MASAREGQHQSGRPWHDKVIAWYEREFRLPERLGFTGRSILQITFGACSD